MVVLLVVQVNLCQNFFFLQNTGRTCCVQKLFWMSETVSVHNMFSPGRAWNFHVLNLQFNEQSVVILWVSWCKNKSFWQRFTCKVHIFWEGHKILRNLHLTFDYSTYSQKLSEDFAKFCGLLRIYELYYVGEKMFRKKFFQIPDDFWGHFRKKKLKKF